MLDCLFDGLIDSLKLLPYLLITFFILEFIEHKLSKKNQVVLTKSNKLGPVMGGLLGALPQCGFSAMASNLFSSKVISIGTLIAIFLSTSDEMLPIMFGEHSDILLIFEVIGLKIVIGIIIGLFVDFICKKGKNGDDKIAIEDLCKKEHCDCKHHGILISSIIHTLKIWFFVLAVNLIINIVVFNIGEENLSNLLLNKNLLTYFLASFVGLIPNCASSIIITKLYLSKFITIGVMISGLLTGSGLGLLLLFKTNKNIKENVKILLIMYFVGVVFGIIVDSLNYMQMSF